VRSSSLDELVRYLCGDEDDVARRDGPLLAVHVELCPARDDVVDLVLAVRLLRVVRPGGELVDAQAERRDAQKLT